MHSVISFPCPLWSGRDEAMLALEQLMCSISEYLRSLRENIPPIPSPGNAPALLLIIFRKHKLKVKKRKMERWPAKKILS